MAGPTAADVQHNSRPLAGLSGAAAAALAAAMKAAETAPKHPEVFARRALCDLADSFAVMLLRPVEDGAEHPEGLLAPAAAGEGASMDVGAISARTVERQALLIFTDFSREEERSAARRLVPQACEAAPQECCVVLVLLPQGGICSRAEVEDEARLFELAMAVGADEVIADPPWSTPELQAVVSIACHRWRRSTTKSQLTLELEPRAPEGEAAALEAARGSLLFGEVRRQLMQQLPPVNNNLVESEQGIAGQYEFVTPLGSGQCGVFRARDLQHDGAEVAVKVTKKNDIWNMNYFDGLYREFLLLRTKLRHEHIVRCHEVLHGPTCIYHVLDFAGDQNLHQTLVEREGGHRLNADEGDQLFLQIGDAVCHCHIRRLSHRSLSTEHITVMRVGAAGALKFTLVDFRSALSANDGQLGQMQHGKMPCMAPEMMAGTPHHPLQVDCWSLGAVLLESSCGRDALAEVIGWDGRSEPSEETAAAACASFCAPGTPAQIAAGVGAAPSTRALDAAEALLRPEPSDRSSAQSAFEAFAGEGWARCTLESPELGKAAAPPQSPTEAPVGGDRPPGGATAAPP